MNLKNFQIKESLASIEKLVSAPLPFKAKLTVSRNKKALAEVAEVYEETFQQILNECVMRDEDGNAVFPKDENGNAKEGQVVIAEDKITEFRDKIRELDNSDVEIEVSPLDVTPELENALSNIYDFDPTPVLWLFED